MVRGISADISSLKDYVSGKLRFLPRSLVPLSDSADCLRNLSQFLLARLASRSKSLPCAGALGASRGRLIANSSPKACAFQQWRVLGCGTGVCR